MLRAAGVTATAGLAGCLGYTIEPTDDIEDRKKRIDDLETQLEQEEDDNEQLNSEIEDLESDIEQKESRIEDLESSVENKDEEIASLESDLASERKKLVSELYKLGDSHRKRASSNWQDASGLYGQGDYSGASNEWGVSTGQYIDAAGAFSEAESAASDQGLTDVAEKIASSKGYVQTMAEAANHFALASYYYSHGNNDGGNDQLNQGNSALDETNQYTLYEPQEIDNSLGL